MKPDLGNPYPPDWPGYPIQMSSQDHIIWIRFRELYALSFNTFYFSVLVGDPILWSEGLDEGMRRVVDHASRRRIDVVGEKDNTWWLMEFRMNTGPGAIGSILTYKTLWEDDPPDQRPVIPVIVTDILDKNLAHVCSVLQIRTFIV